jgi:hypothetical protein
MPEERHERGCGIACLVAVAAALLSGAVGARVPARGQPPIYLGVLAPVFVDGGADQVQALRVRVAFRFLDGRWEAMPFRATDIQPTQGVRDQYPAALVWTVVFDGRSLGEIRTTRPPSAVRALDSAWVAVMDLIPGSKPPLVEGGARSFETWNGPLRVRPLVVVSQPNYVDPDQWKPSQPAPGLLAQGRAAFHKAIDLRLDCGANPTSVYPDEFVQFVRAYRSSRGDALLAFRADPEKNHCYFNYDEWDSVWFYVRNGEFHLLGTGLTLIDEGDYDGDGTSEVILQKSGYNRDGYVLVHLPDASTKTFIWSYH